MVSAFRRKDTTTPIVLMGYYNPIYIHGVDAFLTAARDAGVDGLIIVDLPPEEDEELCIPALKAGLSFIRLTTPTTDDRRLPAVLAARSISPLSQPPIGALGFDPQKIWVPTIPTRWTITVFSTIDFAVAVPTPTGPPLAV